MHPQIVDVPSSRRRHVMPHGTEIRIGGRVRFALWAPAHGRVSLELEGRGDPLLMDAVGQGWHELTTCAPPGTRYRFVLDGGRVVADPASRFQPLDAAGPSEVVDPESYVWRTTDWQPRPWREQVLYELHIGSFTPAGTFDGAIAKLDHLVALGVTAIEIAPVAEFAGQRNWGYDGVFPFAPESSYGRPEDLKRLVDTCHAKGLAVILDVVYNHFGPDGNPFPAVAPQIFTERHRTPWGAAINYDGPDSHEVRELVVHNALYWLEEFQLDGLRLDAVHAIVDESPTHVLHEIAIRARSAFPERHVYLLVENEENDASLLERHPDGRPRLFDAQWNDDVHHVLHCAVTRETAGYYADYAGDTGKLARALAEGFAFQGEHMPYRSSPRGSPCAHLPPSAFVAFLQNHDQVGNRAFGERLGRLAAPEAVRAISAIHLLLPQVPMLFMGEEWDAPQPFLFFCDFDEPLATAVRTGRRSEFAKFPEFADPSRRERIPDPLSQQTFESSKLCWEDLEREAHASVFARYVQLLRVRQREITPLLGHIGGAGRRVESQQGLVIRWSAPAGELLLTANLSDASVSLPPAAGRELWREGDIRADGQCSPWFVRWALVPA